MPTYSVRSRENLRSCHKDLRTIFNAVILHYDCTIIQGHRGEAEQNKAYSEGKSQLKFPQSKHNKSPSMAVDVAPYPIDWSDLDRFYYFAGYVMGVAEMLHAQGMISHRLRYGGDWNRDTQVKDNGFDDLVHFELIT